LVKKSIVRFIFIDEIFLGSVVGEVEKPDVNWSIDPWLSRSLHICYPNAYWSEEALMSRICIYGIIEGIASLIADRLNNHTIAAPKDLVLP
jgi:hypothetical protein